MIKQIKQVEEFHKAYGLRVSPNISECFAMPEEDFERLMELRKNLITEETKEVCAELSTDLYMADVAKELADLCYVIFGTVLTLGIQDQFEAVFDEVHKSNMSKLGEDRKPMYREDGKVLKGPNYFKANIEQLLDA